MKRLALLLCLAASAAWAVSTITLQPGESITVTAAPASSGGGTQPPSGGGGNGNPQPIPGIPLTISFDGVVRDSEGLNSSQTTGIGSFTVPNRIGMASQFKAFEHGQASLWRWAWLTKDPSNIDAAHPMAQGTGVNLSFSIGVPRSGMTTVQPGEVWWIIVRNQKLNGTPSCATGLNCNFGYSTDTPS